MRSIWAMPALLCACMSAGAQEAVPDFTGVWSGTFRQVILADKAGSAAQVKEVKITYELTKQDERLLWGSVWSDPANKRPVVLAFSLNNGTLVGSDPLGLHRMTFISGNRMETCFTDKGSGGGEISATCGVIERAK